MNMHKDCQSYRAGKTLCKDGHKQSHSTCTKYAYANNLIPMCCVEDIPDHLFRIYYNEETGQAKRCDI